jgi:16S rRNA (guanine966-N2)-methyltransferase
MRDPRLRIVAGIWKNRRLMIVDGSRPTSERAREALFDILGESIAGLRVLELFAGSGAVSLEALSRGAASATAVDVDTRALDENRLSLRAPIELVRGDASNAVRRFIAERRRYDVIFLDPPYGEMSPPRLADLAALLSPGGRIVWQSDAGSEPALVEPFRAARTAKYGRNVFTFVEPGR